jgi:hypothetical protein
MASHKFQLGETVLLTSFNRNVPGGSYEVSKLLPHNGQAMSSNIESRVRTKTMSASREKAN